MEKKKLNLATVETALKNESLRANEKDEKELISFILLDRVNNEEKKSEHHTFLHGDDTSIAAAIAMRMLEVEGFRNIIYKAVFAYENTMKAKMEKAFEGVDKALGTLIDNFESIFDKEPAKKKRMRKQ